MILKFGKHKGSNFYNTPKSYQNWLLKQEWFKIENTKPLHKQLNGWDGHGKTGEAIYDQVFEQEKNEGDILDEMSGVYSEGGMYYGI